MFERFTDRARRVMGLANQEAQRSGHEYLGSEHILLGLLREGAGTGAHALLDLGVDLRRLRIELEKRISPESTAERGIKLPQTPFAKTVIEHAIKEARAFGHRYVGTEHLLLGLVRDGGRAGTVLRELGVTIDAARKTVLKRLAAEAPEETELRPGIPSTKPAPGPSSGTYDRFTDRARKVLALANAEAQRFNHEYIGSEHILLGLVKEGSGVGANVLKNLEVDLRRARLEVEKLVKPGPEMVTMGKLPLTPRAKKVIGYAMEEARGLNHNYVGTEHLLLGLLREHDGIAAQVLRNLGVKLEAVRDESLDMLGASLPPYVSESTEQGPPVLKAGCPLCARIEACTGRTDPSLIVQLLESYVVLGDNQGCEGWCVLILGHHAEHLADVDPARQARVWHDVSRVASAIRAVFPDTGKDGCPPRINYECLGNLVPHIHWHVIPRHVDDPDPTKPVWGWPEAQLKGTMTDAERAELIAKLRQRLR